MAYKKSFRDNFTQKLAPVYRRLLNINIQLHGTKTTVLRIFRTRVNRFGDFGFTFDTQVIGNTIIRYPFTNLEMFGKRGDANPQGLKQSEVHALDLTDLLPIEMTVEFVGEYADDPINIQRDDIIVDILKDEFGRKIPVVMQVTKLLGSFFGKDIVSKKVELSLVRGQLEEELQTKIDAYIAAN